MMRAKSEEAIPLHGTTGMSSRVLRVDPPSTNATDSRELDSARSNGYGRGVGARRRAAGPDVSRAARYRMIPNDIHPFAIIERADGSLAASWMRNSDGGDGVDSESLDGAVEDRRLLPEVIEGLRRYFDGAKNVDFGFIDTPRGPAFHRACWIACRDIPYGKTCSYAELAAAAGSPLAFRAAGQSMRHNPLPVIVPCHRVIGSNDRLHGYGGSCDSNSESLAIKRALLRLEGASV